MTKKINNMDCVALLVNTMHYMEKVDIGLAIFLHRTTRDSNKHGFPHLQSSFLVILLPEE